MPDPFPETVGSVAADLKRCSACPTRVTPGGPCIDGRVARLAAKHASTSQRWRLPCRDALALSFHCPPRPFVADRSRRCRQTARSRLHGSDRHREAGSRRKRSSALMIARHRMQQCGVTAGRTAGARLERSCLRRGCFGGRQARRLPRCADSCGRLRKYRVAGKAGRGPTRFGTWNLSGCCLDAGRGGRFLVTVEQGGFAVAGFWLGALVSSPPEAGRLPRSNRSR